MKNKKLSPVEDTLVWILKNSGKKITSKDLAKMTSKKENTIKNQIYSINKKQKGLISKDKQGFFMGGK